MRLPEQARAALAAALEARGGELWDAMRGELQADGAEVAFWFAVPGPGAIPAVADLLRDLTAELREAYDGATFSAGFVTALPDGVLLWDSLTDAEIRGEAPPRAYGAAPQAYALSEFGPGAELFPIEIPVPPGPPAPS
jgi:hypothetical protein